MGHAHFEAVHPFPNGNGRVGRAGRAQVFAAEELIALLSRPFGSDVDSALKAGRRMIGSG